jgi:hypothetical protein
MKKKLPKLSIDSQKVKRPELGLVVRSGVRAGADKTVRVRIIFNPLLDP